MKSCSLSLLRAFAASLRLVAFAVFSLVASLAAAETRTWDGKHDTSNLRVTVVYFVPSDRAPLPDWRDRAQYFCRRIEQFHAREFGGQSNLTAVLHEAPLVSRLTTGELRRGDADAIFFRTLQETDERLEFSKNRQPGTFPVLLVLSEINWRPLDDFYRLQLQEGQVSFEGNYNGKEHFPGARSGGARATYLEKEGLGWGLVSADGWRVPYRGSDCVIYHEGCGHTVGLPHPLEQNGSVMSLGQYQGWLNESWLDVDQKKRLGWRPDQPPARNGSQLQLFSRFRAIPVPPVPRPDQPVHLALDWPKDAKVKSLRVRFQTAIDGPWIDAPQDTLTSTPKTARLGTFERATPVSYRVDAELEDGATAELWGYLQVRNEPQVPPRPINRSPDLIVQTVSSKDNVVENWPENLTDLLAGLRPDNCWQTGTWRKEDKALVSPKQYGARLQLPYAPPDEYRLTLVVEPLDEPNGLILGQVLDKHRFVTLFNFHPEESGLSAIENIDGRNVGNESTFSGNLFRKGQLSMVTVTVTLGGLTMSVDGRTIVDWKGAATRLSLSDYWKTPDESALFLGTYDCSYRFHRITVEPIRGQSKGLADAVPREGSKKIQSK